MKRTFPVALLLLLGAFVSTFSQGNDRYLDKTFVFAAYYDDTINPDFKFVVSKNRLQLDIPELDESKNEDGIYIQSRIDEQYSIATDGPFDFLVTSKNKYMVLAAGSVCILIDSKTNDSFWGLEISSPYIHLVPGNVRHTFIGLDGGMLDFQSTSSFLTETIKGVQYKYNGIDKFYYSLRTPWVEGKKDYGKGEWISKRIVRPSDKVMILNGFIDATRPYLFESNSRVKRIGVSSTDGTWEYDLADSPLPQILSLPIKVVGNIRFTILDVYPGEKYKDTALSAVFFLDEFGK